MIPNEPSPPELAVSPGSSRRAGRTSICIAWLIRLTTTASLILTALGVLLLVLNRYHPNGYFFDYWAEYTGAAASCSTLGAVIASRRPANPIGWIFCAAGLSTAVEHFVAEYAAYALLAEPGSLPGGEAMAWISTWMWVPSIGLFVFLGLLFPDGRFPSPPWKWVAWLDTSVIVAGALSMAFLPGPIDGLGPIHNPLGLANLDGFDGESVGNLIQALLGVLGILAAAAVLVRLRRTDREGRQQIKWFAYAGTILAGGTILAYTVAGALGGVFWLWLIGFILVLVGIVGIPIAVSTAILRYRLYDIDLIINRTLVYGSLTASVVGTYALVVGGIGTLLEYQGSFVISLLASGVVAVLFQPLRHRLQQGVNRLMYGERDEPYKVLASLGQRLEEVAVAPNAVFEAITETTARALKLPYAALDVEQDGELVRAAEYGSPVGKPVILPIEYQTKQIGRLVLAPRAPGEAFTPPDRKLLGQLSRQAGAAIHTVRLASELQRSREQLVRTREEERRRLRRDLHDGLGPTLAGLALKHDAARYLLAQDPAAVDALLAGLKAQTQEAACSIRRLVYDLRPPALDQLGLLSAIREQAANYSHSAEAETGQANELNFLIEAPGCLPPLPAAVEVACYRVVQEAITNVARHARAHTCSIRLSLDDADDVLELEITDDGVGLPADHRVGVGLNSMRERATELGGSFVIEPATDGGTRVLARLPLPPREGGHSRTQPQEDYRGAHQDPDS